MRVNYPYLHQQFAEDKIEDFLSDIRQWATTGEFTLGPYVDKFEKSFGEYIGAKHIISTNTGTDALILALKSLGIGPGDEVITVPNTFYATVGAIVAVGAKPVFVDVDKRMNIDVSKVQEAITDKTKALLPVWWMGTAPNMSALQTICQENNLKMVEDACPAIGGTQNKQHAGTFGDLGAFSMHPLKPLNVWGDGGMIATNSDELADWLRCYRNHGMVDRDHISMWGVNARLQPFQSIVGMHMLNNIEVEVRQRREQAQYLDKALAPLEGRGLISIPPRNAEDRDVYQLYVISARDRNKLVQNLVDNEVEAKVHYPVALHLQEAAKDLGYKKGDFPEAEKQADEIITLPAHPFLSKEQLDFMVDRITNFYRDY